MLLVATFILATCGNAQKQSENATAKGDKNGLVVMYFHGKQRCATCNAIESKTKELLHENFADELASGKILLEIIDISLPENEEIANKYEVSWASLILDKGRQIENLTDIGFGYAKNQPEVFKRKLNEKIVQMLQ